MLELTPWCCFVLCDTRPARENIREYGRFPELQTGTRGLIDLAHYGSGY